MLIIDSKDFLSKEQIKNQAPSVFTKTASANVSDAYTHIPTSRVIEDMEKLGWGVVDAKEVKARKGIGFQKHLVVFRNPEIAITGKDRDDVFPQILLTNSHDGKNSFIFTAGMFRLVCENGLVIATEEFENVKLRHMGYTFEELQERIKEMVERLPLTVETMNKMKQTTLTEKQAEEFALKALSTRFKEDEVKRISVDVMDLLKPTRKEDEGDDLWSIFNVIQEKLISGGFSYATGSKSRKARQIKNFNQDLKVNRDLFELALEFAN